MIIQCRMWWGSGLVGYLFEDTQDIAHSQMHDTQLPGVQKAKARLSTRTGLCYKNPGDDLLSHAVAHIVPSALRGLSALFGMGRGISPAV